MTRRDRHRVRLLARDVRRLGAGDGPVLAEPGEERRDLVERRRGVRRGARARCFAGRSAVYAVFERGVVHRDLRVVPDDLGVAGVRLELQTAAVRVRPEAPGGAGHQRRTGLARQRARGEQLVREGDPCGHACRLCGAECVVDRLGERLRRRRRAAAAARCDGDDARRRARATIAASRAIKRDVGRVRKIFTAILSRVPRRRIADRL